MRAQDGVKALRVLLWLGAAMSEATPEQRTAIRRTVLPVIEDRRPERVVLARIRDVMGPRWRPSGEWARQLDALGL